MSFLWRISAVSLAACAAFALHVPFVDRLGTLALSVGCLALVRQTAKRSPAAATFPAGLPDAATVAELAGREVGEHGAQLRSQLAQYGKDAASPAIGLARGIDIGALTAAKPRQADSGFPT